MFRMNLESILKHFLPGFICLVTMVFLLAGCSRQEQEADEGPVTITIWHDKEEEVAAVLQDALNQLAPDIIVKLERKDGLTDSLKMVGNDPNAAPDMYFFAHDKIPNIPIVSTKNSDAIFLAARSSIRAKDMPHSFAPTITSSSPKCNLPYKFLTIVAFSTL